MELAGIDKDTPNPQGGEIARDPETGAPTGLLVELSAGFMVRYELPPYPAEVVDNALKQAFQQLFSLGITSIQDTYVIDGVLLDRLANLDRQGIPMPYAMIHLGWFYPEGKFKERLEATIRNREQYAARHVNCPGNPEVVQVITADPTRTVIISVS